MKKPELYQKTVDILHHAYQSKSLFHGDCSSCAVGHLCKIAQEESKIMDVPFWYWKGFFYTEYKHQHLNEYKNYWKSGEKEATAKLLKATGYSRKELARIEYAFESSRKYTSTVEDIENGLMAVIDCLDQIHGNTDTEVTTTQKNRFTKLVTV